jgi:flagellar hook protein FlgE
MPSFYIPLSGLDADNTALNTIANNLSNMNTTGFKAQTTNFSDLFFQEIGTTGSGDEIQGGTGVQVASNTTDFSTGSISSTGDSTDAAINGSGFFVLDNSGSQLYTRDGSFQLSSSGQLESSGGLSVMGYGAVNGVINTNGGLTDINIPTGQVMQPAATGNFSITANLNSASAVGATTTSQVSIYDSLGQSYEANVAYTKTGPNTWSYGITVPDTISPVTNAATNTTTFNFGSVGTAGGATLATVDPATNLTITGNTASGTTATITAPTVTAGQSIASYMAALQTQLTTAGITGVTIANPGGGNSLTITGATATAGSVVQDPVASAVSTGTLTFDSSGNLVSPATNVGGITFSGLSDQASPLKMTWDLFGSSGAGNISQTVAASSTSATTQNGYASGQYQSFAVAADGTVSVSYSNGQSKNVGQVAIATVSNEQGLVAVGGSNYQTTTASGSAAVGIAGDSGRGSIQGSSLEASNVNISAEFSDLIIAQRAFEANSKAVTTFDSVTEQAINMIH